MNELYDRFIAPLPEDDICRRSWRFTPEIVDAYTGDADRARRYDMVSWLVKHFGPPAQPYGDDEHARAGRWREGQTAVMGYTWFGFADPADAETFLAAWPDPALAQPTQQKALNDGE